MAHYVIVGAGRVGRRLASHLDAAGHSVALVDRSAHAVEGADPADVVVGIGFDRDALRRAGIEHAQGLAAVTADDSTNIISARVARETFHVPHVVARIYDAERARVYQRLGIPTVASVEWTADQVLHRLLPVGTADPTRRDPSGRLLMTESMPHRSWCGLPLTRVEELAGLRIAYLTRYGEGMLPAADGVLQEGDVVHAVYPVEDRDRVEMLLQGEAARARTRGAEDEDDEEDRP